MMIFRWRKSEQNDSFLFVDEVRLEIFLSFSVEELAEYLLKEVRKSSSNPKLLTEQIDLKKFNGKIDETEEKICEDETFPVNKSCENVTQRKKRSFLPFNIDDYEKRRSARSVRFENFPREKCENVLLVSRTLR